MAMNDKGFNRREFLKKFALLSSTPLMAHCIYGCDLRPSTGAVYGPAPPDDTAPEVYGIYLHVAQAGDGDLNLNEDTNVPVDASFEVEFTEAMDITSINGIHIRCDNDDTEVSIEGVWMTMLIALITPVSNLNQDSRYTLFVDESVKDQAGNLINLTQMSSASFETI
jgi:hypothetical protein